ncbi:MAG: 16S rRNA (cytosine(967)-C(5))-methyltransferase [Gammaproteobacteria bacterium RIFCSPHIGHO2_02_FULL_42_13]|nr:MAG: 16S rRNA (cytosine(967)-C(5))-methyltransferase [Gammaproteobacteria bacterium RIFCSPHIGHO2_02_FULL_42_13]
MTPRLFSLEILCDLFIQHQSLSSLQQKLKTYPNQSERAYIQVLCYGVARWYLQLDFIAKRLLSKPLKQKDQTLHILILIGLYELLYTKTPDYAVVTEAVNVVRALKKSWAQGLINAVLRNFLRRKEELLKTVSDNEAVSYSHPAWLLTRLKKEYPHAWKEIVTANNQCPPMSLRVNQNKISRDEYGEKLRQVGLRGNILQNYSDAILLEKPCAVGQLPGFSEGDVSVQDCGAQLAVTLLDLKPDQRVLDACAAPGGKTCHILEYEPNISTLVAIDHDAKRLALVGENLARSSEQGKSSADAASSCSELIVGDAAEPDAWWDGKVFDRILLDAPCSATGVIRRHPDIKFLRREEDIATLAKTQLRLLQSLWLLLKPGGKLLYVTCSVLAEENQQVIQKFLHQNQLDLSVLAHEQQLLPTVGGSDGFYYACLTKIL